MKGDDGVKKGILIAIVILLVLVMLFAGWKMWGILSDYRQGEAVYEEMDQYISVPEPTQKVTVSKETEETTEPEPEEGTITEKTEGLWEAPEVDFKALWKVNKDVVGWIYIPDTKVNYPILQGRDNDQYLRHMIDGKYNTAGSVFLESDIPDDFSSRNNPIYGHNMKNGTMFATVAKYKKQKFYDEHPIGYLVTPEKTYLVRFFAGYVLTTKGDAWDTGFTEAEYKKWLNKACKKSYFASDVVPTTDYNVLTLSTCSYETNDARFVLHGLLEEL